MSEYSKIKFGRIYIVVSVIVLFWMALQVRLYFIQVKNHEFYEKQSRLQSAKKIDLQAKRGEIYDRNGERLATNLIHYDLGVDISKIENKNEIADKFSKNFGRSKNYYLRKLKRGTDFEFLERKVVKEKAQFLENFSDAGLVKFEGFRRIYPFRNYGSQIIGFTDVDDNGVSGLEMQYDNSLKGKKGWTFLLADARRRFGYNVDFPGVVPEPGINISLTIDKNYQTIVEDELEAAVKKTRANYGIAVLMEPNSGKVLSICSSPGYNPNNPGNSIPENRKMRSISESFEPGSTFKVFPAAALLQEGIKRADDIVFCENGSYKFRGHVINDTKPHAWLTFKRVIENSSNIGMVKLTADLPKHTLYRYLKNFGFDSYTGINLMGENSGSLSKPQEFSGLSKAVISFGQEVGVTALQITNAFCAIVNGGYLMRPFVVEKVFDNHNNIIEENTAEQIRRVISSNIAQELKRFMLDAVKRGTGKKAAIEGVEVGGKTGTAQKFDKESKKYKTNGYLSSFIGYAPFDKPEFVLAIFLDEPQMIYYGGEVAAPVFAKIMKRILNYAPLENPASEHEFKMVQSDTKIPDLTYLPVSAAEEILILKDQSYSVMGNGSHIIAQKIDSDELQLKTGIPEIEMNRVPDLKGLTIREALNRIDFTKLVVKIEGKGKVQKQTIPPGSTLKKQSVLLLYCAN